MNNRADLVGIVLAGRPADAVVTREDFDATVRSRNILGEGVGMLKQRHHLTAGEAFDLLARMSRAERTTLREIAQRIAAVDWLP